MTFSIDFQIRYGEVDLQGVVFNAHYLAYVDHCVDQWLRSLDVIGGDNEWDIMVKKATVEWSGSAGHRWAEGPRHGYPDRGDSFRERARYSDYRKIVPPERRGP